MIKEEFTENQLQLDKEIKMHERDTEYKRSELMSLQT